MNILNVDIKRINNGIDQYCAINSENLMPYLICSEETEKLIISQCCVCGSKEGLERFNKEPKISAYCGCKILNDNSLKLGEIEIR